LRQRARRNNHEEKRMPDVIIVGGGISGTAAAWELASEGHSVTLLEARSLAAMASGWTLAGVRQSGRDPAELPLARSAVDIWAGLSQALGADVGYRRGGNLRLARDEAEAGVIRDLVDEQRALGLELEFIEGNAAVREIAPALSANILAASHCPSDGHADPLAAVSAFADAARRSGADIREGVRVTGLLRDRDCVIGVETADGPLHADRVVVAAGVHAPDLLAPLGLDLPLDLQLVFALQTVPLPPLLQQVIGVANADCALRQQIDGRVRATTGIGPWTHALEGWKAEDLHPTAEAVGILGERLAAIVPAMRDAPLAKLWGGLIDLTPDALPVLDTPAQVPGLVIAAGFSGHGFCLGPVTGQIIADLALGRSCRHPIAPFALARFADSVPGVQDLSLHG
jgi:sarcosine oxidase subunit beta